MMTRMVVSVGPLIGAGVLVAAGAFQAQQCRHGADESVDQGARRQAAIRYLRDMNTTEGRLRLQQGTYVSLAEAEAAGSSLVPFGFVPRLTFDRWGYVISLKDALDPCRFSLFADQDNVIYEAHPIPRTDLTSTAGT